MVEKVDILPDKSSILLVFKYLRKIFKLNVDVANLSGQPRLVSVPPRNLLLKLMGSIDIKQEKRDNHSAVGEMIYPKAVLIPIR